MQTKKMVIYDSWLHYMQYKKHEKVSEQVGEIDELNVEGERYLDNLICDARGWQMMKQQESRKQKPELMEMVQNSPELDTSPDVKDLDAESVWSVSPE